MAVTAAVMDVLLGVVVLASWLGCIGFARLKSPLDRVHCVAFVNVTAGTALAVVGFVADGASGRACKILLLVVLSVVAGAVSSHVIGRAQMQRAIAAPEHGS